MVNEITLFLESVAQFEPLVKFLIAIVIILIGWLVAGAIGELIIALLNKIRLNQALKRMGWESALLKADISLNASKFFGGVVKWCFVVIFLMVACEVVELTEFTMLLGKIISYLPNIIIAALIFIIAVYLADFSYRIVIASAEKAKITYAKLLGTAIRWSIWVFAIFAIFLQLGITPDIIKAIIYGIIAMIVLAGGLAFGLGGKDLAAAILKELKEKIS